MKFRLSLAAALVACIPLLGITTAHAASVKIVMSNDNNNKGLKGQTFEKLIEEIKARLGDRVKIEMHHSGTLFDQNSQIQGLQLGGASIIAPTTGIYASVSKKINAFDLPFLLDTPDKILAAMHDPVIRGAFVPELEAKNITPIAFWMNGPRELGYTGDKTVLVPADVAGMKIRVQSAPVYVQTFEAVKANAVAINWSEAPTALQQGVIDGAEVTPNAWRGSGIYKMISQITLTNHMYSYYLVGANKHWWDGLSAGDRKAIEDALDATTKWNIENARKINEADIAFIQQAGVKINTLTPEQRALWVAAMKPVWKALGDDLVGEAVMKRLKEIAGVPAG